MAIDVAALKDIENEFVKDLSAGGKKLATDSEKEIQELIEYYVNGDDFKKTGSVRIWPTILCKYLYKDLWAKVLPNDATDEEKKKLKNQKAAKKQKVKTVLKNYCEKHGLEYEPSPAKQGPVEGYVDVKGKKKK